MFRDIFGPLHYGHVLPTKPSLGLYPPRNCSFQGEIDWNRWVKETFFLSCLLSNSTFRVRSFPFSVPLYDMECKEWRKMSLPSVSMRKGLHVAVIITTCFYIWHCHHPYTVFGSGSWNFSQFESWSGPQVGSWSGPQFGSGYKTFTLLNFQLWKKRIV